MSIYDPIEPKPLTRRQRQWRKHKVREKQIELLHELTRAQKHVRPVDLEALRENANVGLYIQALEAIAANALPMLEAACQPLMWEKIAPRLPGGQASLFP